jgi:hypothetical protein
MTTKNISVLSSGIIVVEFKYSVSGFVSEFDSVIRKPFTTEHFHCDSVSVRKNPVQVVSIELLGTVHFILLHLHFCEEWMGFLLAEI